MSNPKLIPVLNLSAFAEGYLDKSACLGVSVEEALGLLYLNKKASMGSGAAGLVGKGLEEGGKAWPWLATLLGINMAGDKLLEYGKTTMGAGLGAAQVAANVAKEAPNLAQQGIGLSKDILGLGLLGGAGVGGLAWLMRQNALTEAKKKAAKQQLEDQASVQSEDLKKAFAPAPEEKVKPYSTVTSSPGYEV